MTVEVLQVPPSAVVGMWSEVEDMLEPAIRMSQGCYESEDVMAECAAGDCQLWVACADDAVVAAYVTRVIQYPRKRVVRAVFAGGKPGTMSDWLDPMVQAIEAWSKQWRCEAIEAVGRKGWTRVVDGEQIAVHLWRDFPPMEMH